MTEGLALFVAYLLGSLPFGMILVHFFGQGDLRQMGSGNIGATNVVRTQGKSLGACAFSLDAGKGIAVCAGWAPFLSDASWLPWIGVSAICGHCFSCFLKGRGGKGVATALGVFLFLTPSVGLVCLLVWGSVFWLSRISSLASLVSIGSAPLLLVLFSPSEGEEACLWAYIGMALLIFLRHRANIKRLIHGEEKEFRSTS
ncbi:MAG: glycerol-3-phosphate 1-O-acyltransferase PlsY [Holosporales bacterium]|jgi:glycerol-3-phosphate acyltransferase PlsY|nr:glycerol-3-phosphate 1-O-acyltransferase PlsY [Holosporales bacterium]